MKVTPPMPEQLLDPEGFPDDLAWVPAHYRLNPDDPVYLLIAWHWRRVKKSEDTIAAATLELRTLLDSGARTYSEAADGVLELHEALAKLEATLADTPNKLSEQLEARLTLPMEQALSRAQSLERSLGPVARSFEKGQRLQVLAALLVGVCLGALAAVIVLFA